MPEMPENLEIWRKSLGLTQGQLGEKLEGRGQKIVSAYERGAAAIPESVQAQIREMGFTGPFPTLKQSGQDSGVGEIHNILDETEAILSALKEKGMFPAPNPEAEHEFRKVIAEKLARDFERNVSVSREERVEQWWTFAEAFRKAVR